MLRGSALLWGQWEHGYPIGLFHLHGESLSLVPFEKWSILSMSCVLGFIETSDDYWEYHAHEILHVHCRPGGDWNWDGFSRPGDP